MEKEGWPSSSSLDPNQDYSRKQNFLLNLSNK